MPLNICGSIYEYTWLLEEVIKVHKLVRLSWFRTAGLVYAPCLAADTELLDEAQICFAIAISNVLEEAAALADQAQQTTAGCEVVPVALQMFS